VNELALLPVFVVGLLSGVHCAGMCGGIVGTLAQSRTRAGGAPPLALHLAYSAGRIASYALAGALAGGAGGVALSLHATTVLQTAFLLAASMMLILLGLYLAGWSGAVRGIEAAGALLWRRVEPWSRGLLPADTVPRALGLGALWGWLPCGLVYSVLVTALATGSAAHGALVMLAFGLGTLPNLLAIGVWFAQFRRAIGSVRMRVAAGLAVAAFGLYGLAALGHALLTGGDPHRHHVQVAPGAATCSTDARAGPQRPALPSSTTQPVSGPGGAR
jgi:sulfite exporter TauE/SafE